VDVPGAIAAPNAGVVPQSAPRIILWPGRSLNAIFLTVQALDANLTPSATLLRDAPFGEGGSYPAEVPITLDGKALQISRQGFYALKIGATVVNGTPATLRLVLYYASL
jgi:hypothetical protein